MKITRILAMILFAGTFFACGGNKQEDAVQQEEKPKVKLAKASEADVEQIEEYTAIVESDLLNNISSNSPLRIERIMVDVGDKVTKGQLLVQMDASSLQQLKLQVDNLQLEFDRMNELYKVGGVSKAEWDNAKTQLEVNRTSYKTMLENTKLVSPISGVITARNYDNGDMAGANPILTVATLSPVKMIINVSETYYPKVSKGMKAKVLLDTYGDEVFDGEISIVYPTINSQTHTFPVEVTLKNSDSRVRPGMFARVTLSFGTERHTMVPDQAVVKQMGSGDYYVYEYHKDGKVTHNKVKLGRRIDNQYEIVSGVSSTADVVIAGQTRLADGVAVEVLK